MDSPEETNEYSIELVPRVDLVNTSDPDLDVLDEAAACCINGKTYSKFEYRLNRAKKLIENGHESVLEHVYFTFEIECSRAALQQIARHRMASLSVMSTRYTLHQRKFKFYKVPPSTTIDPSMPNDKLKYTLPESLMTRLFWTINLRSLRNFYRLRSAPCALEEMRDICELILEAFRAMNQSHFVELIKL